MVDPTPTTLKVIAEDPAPVATVIITGFPLNAPLNPPVAVIIPVVFTLELAVRLTAVVALLAFSDELANVDVLASFAVLA